MLGPKCPLGILRLHPQSLEVEIPVWTGLVDKYQAVMLTEWYWYNLGMRDEDGGLWMYDNDWWPIVWSQHMSSPGDAIMVGWALMLAGRFKEGVDVVKTIANASFRSSHPGINYLFDEHGKMVHIRNHWDVATGQGAYFRAVVEGIFGIVPAFDKNQVTVIPRIPLDWPEASFSRSGLSISFKRQQAGVYVEVHTDTDVIPTLKIPVRASILNVKINGYDSDWCMETGMRHAFVVLELPKGGGIVEIEYEESALFNLLSPEQVTPGDSITFKLDSENVIVEKWEDRYDFYSEVHIKGNLFTGRLSKAGCGQAVVFAHCRSGNIMWIEPVFTNTLPKTAKRAIRPLVSAISFRSTKYSQIDLSSTYTDDIQQCFLQMFHFDSHDFEPAKGLIKYWNMPYFRLANALPTNIEVKGVPFTLGRMEVDGKKQKNLIMLSNTPPYEMATSVDIKVPELQAYKLHLLTLNMHLPQKCYIPALLVTIKYEDGTIDKQELIPPINFDCYYRNYALDVQTLPLDTEPAYLDMFSEGGWPSLESVRRASEYYSEFFHLSMTTIKCNPLKRIISINLSSIATETFCGVAGITFSEAVPISLAKKSLRYCQS
jgi:hypothetical protein